MPARLRIGDTALAWEGFRLGVDRPIDLRLTDVTPDRCGRAQRLAVPQAELSLSLGALLFGRLQPRAIELDRPRLLFRRAADGTLSLDLGGLPDHRGERHGQSAARPAGRAGSAAGERSHGDARLASARSAALRIHDAAVTVQDRQIGVTWQAPQAEIDLTRDPAGGVERFAPTSRWRSATNAPGCT